MDASARCFAGGAAEARQARPHDYFGCEPMSHPHRTTVLRLISWCRLNGTVDQDTNKGCHPN